MSPAAFVAELRRRGAFLWLDGGRVRCRAPRGVLTERVVAYLGRHKAAVVAALDEEARRDPDGLRLAAALAIFDAEPIEEPDRCAQRPLFDQEDAA